MTRPLFPLFLFAFGLPCISHAHDHAPRAVEFVENKGQWQQPFLFRADVAGATLFLEADGITWIKLQEDASDIMHDIAELPPDQREQVMLAGHAWRMKFDGASAHPIVRPGKINKGSRNYFLGNDPSSWRSDVRSFGSITYEQVWPGIDMVFQGSGNGNLKYDIVVHPGADPSMIALSFEGLDGMRISEAGELVLSTSVGEVKELSPFTYYADDREPIENAFKLTDGKLTFDLTGHDASRKVIIDPELIAATYSSAVGASNYGHCATYDDEGNIYTGARSFGSGYPTTLGAFQMNYGGGYVDISLSKINPDGSELIWATYLGGGQEDLPHSLIVNQQGQLCVLGSSMSTDYPITASAYQPENGGSTDMVITVFSEDGGSLIGSTYLGGTEQDGANNMAGNYGEQYRGEILVDGGGNILVASFSRSPDMPVTPGALQTTHGGMQDGVILSMNNTCSDLLWSTFLGGSQNDGAFGIRTIGNEVVVCGQTFSTDLPTTAGAYQTVFQGEQDGFVARIANNGSQLVACTYFGTTNMDRPYFIDTDSNGDLWIYGQTQGNITIQPADVFSEPDGTIFLAKFDPGLTEVLLSTSFGTGFNTAMTPVAFLVDNCDKIYVSGYGAGASTLPLSSDALASNGSFYLAAFDVDMSALVFGSHYGGNHVDGGTSRFDKNGIVYQGVCASGNSMATTNWAFAPTQAISWDIGVFKIDFQVAGVTAAGASPINEGCAPIEIQFSNTSTGTDWTWDFGDGTAVVSAFEPSHNYVEAGNYTVTLIASDSMACNLADTVHFEITIGEATPVEASFTSDQDPGCSVQEVSFTNTSTAGVAQYVWDMGDGTVYTDTNVVHMYPSPGNYTVQLTVTDPTGCSQPDSIAQPIQVVTDVVLVEAIAEITPPGTCEQTVTGVNSSTGVAPAFQWDLGDGTIVEQAQIEHTYTAPGNYTITFIAFDPQTCNGSDTLTWAVVIEEPIPDTLEFTADVQQICATAEVQTTNLSPGGADLVYSWDMGDGNELSGFEIDHTYDQPGYYSIVLSATDPAGCAAPIPFYLPVYVAEPEPINAGFAVELDDSCEGTTLTGLNFSSGDDLAYEWSFGDGSTSTDSTAEHFYEDGGEYMLQLIVQDLNGCVPNDTMQQAILVNGSTMPVAVFDHTLIDNCEGGQFIGEISDPGPYELTWITSDGAQFNGNYFDHQFTQEGEYDVTLIVSDPAGCGSDSASVTVQVVMPLLMDLSFNLVEEYQCGQTTVSCTNTSIGNDLTYIWWTSDNFSYYGPEMQHTFTEPGEYEIRFYGLDPMECSGPDSVVVTITVAPVEPVTAEFDLVQTSDCNGTTVQASTANTSNNVSYTWSLGDGTQLSDPQIEHLYTDPGVYAIELTVTDNSGCSDPMTTMQEIEVAPPPYITASFDVETSQDCGIMEVVLQNTSTGDPAEMSWDMGNGDILPGEAVAYTYDQPGQYSITLTVSDPESCNGTDTETMAITVDPLPELAASFQIEESGGCGELQVNCTNTSTGSGISYAWIMGDGTTFDTPNADHLYTVPGNYSILLIATEGSGCLPPDTAMVEIEVPAPPSLDIEMAVQQIGDCSVMQIECTNNSPAQNVQWIWDMGDGTQYGDLNVTHAFTAPGVYNVSLMLIDTMCGGQQISVIPIAVDDGVPVVQLSSPVLCEGSAVTLDASATPGLYEWSNGSTDHSITIEEPGTYSVTVQNANGCTGTADITIPLVERMEITDSIAACPDAMVPLTVPIEGVAYSWSTGGIGRAETVRGPGDYTFAVTDDNGCQHSGTFTVEALDAEAQLFAPNAFTPDGDGINDLFTIYGHGEEEARLTIYDRWGELLFDTKDSPPSWDGFYDGETVKQDVYVYQLQYRSVCSNEVVNTTGHVTVVR